MIVPCEYDQDRVLPRLQSSPGGLVLDVEDAKRAGANLFQTVHDAVHVAMSRQRD